VSSWSCDGQGKNSSTHSSRSFRGSRPSHLPDLLRYTSCGRGCVPSGWKRPQAPLGWSLITCGRLCVSPAADAARGHVAAHFLFLTHTMPTFARLAHGENVLFRLTPRPAPGIPSVGKVLYLMASSTYILPTVVPSSRGLLFYFASRILTQIFLLHCYICLQLHTVYSAFLSTYQAILTPLPPTANPLSLGSTGQQYG
jgi:hypothetical protein